VSELSPLRPYWRVVASSVPGVSHTRSGLECQDAHVWLEREDGISVAAIADGAGSAARGGVGAEIAARTAAELLLTSQLAGEETLEAHIGMALRAARMAVLAAASEQGCAPRDLATTLIVIVLGHETVGVGQIGDGATVLADEHGDLHLLTAPSADEYINETTFLTADDGLDEAQIVVSRRAASRIAAFTDGLQRLALKMPSGEPHAPFFAPLFHFAAQPLEPAEAVSQLETFLRSPRIMERADDDLTLLLAAYNGLEP
jgi:hypothetical protein